MTYFYALDIVSNWIQTGIVSNFMQRPAAARTERLKILDNIIDKR